MKHVVEIKRISYSYECGIHRVSADVGGEILWFESRDAILYPAPEAFISAFLIPALSLDLNLTVDGRLNPDWKNNLTELMSVYRKWWGYPGIEIRGGDQPEPCFSRGDRTALCFSGGVDSFFSLLRGGCKIDDLVFVHGFDIPLSDKGRFDIFKKSLGAIAQKSNACPVVIRTNLREHSMFARINWERTHGGALASIAHVLAGTRKFLISSSSPFCYNKPWGSHWKTDALWATDDFKIIYMGGEYWRSEKLAMIADDPLVREHLRVCWENRENSLNCCSCEKCLRTMLILLTCHKLEKFTTFKNKDNIEIGINRIPFIKHNLIPAYKDFLKGEIPNDLKKSIRALIFRSRLKLLLCKISFHGLLSSIWRLFPRVFRQNIKRSIGYRTILSIRSLF